MSACGLCGHTPACGSAEIDGTRYCHGDCPHEDAGFTSCYERAVSMHPVLASLTSTWQGRTVLFGLADPTPFPRIRLFRLFRRPKETR